MPSYQRDAKRIIRRIELMLPETTRGQFFRVDIPKILDLQESIFGLQIDIQNAIAKVKPLVRKDKDAKAHHGELRRLRWLSRRLGDALAWTFFASNRQHLDSLAHNNLTPIPLTKESDGVRGIWLTARTQVGPNFGIPLVHDITSCLRVGDITFLNVEGADSDDPELVDRSKLRLVHRTVEVKTRRVSEEQVDDETSDLVLQVTMIGNEPFPELPPSLEPLEPAPALLPRRNDARTLRQLERMDSATERKNAPLDAISTIDGAPLLTLSHHEDARHHWPELRRSIRAARKSGYDFFSIDGYVGYAVYYNSAGLSTSDIRLEALGEDLRGLLVQNVERNRITFTPIPAEEDTQHAVEIMPPFLYDVPQRAMREMLRGQLLIMGAINSGRIEALLSEEGFTVIPEGKDGDFRFEAQVAWPTGEIFTVSSPAPWREMMVSAHEFVGINSVLAKARSLKDLPNRISIKDFKKTWDDGATQRKRRGPAPDVA